VGGELWRAPERDAGSMELGELDHAILAKKRNRVYSFSGGMLS
jgi:hypothetical protein